MCKRGLNWLLSYFAKLPNGLYLLAGLVLIGIVSSAVVGIFILPHALSVMVMGLAVLSLALWLLVVAALPREKIEASSSSFVVSHERTNPFLF